MKHLRLFEKFTEDMEYEKTINLLDDIYNDKLYSRGYVNKDRDYVYNKLGDLTGKYVQFLSLVGSKRTIRRGFVEYFYYRNQNHRYVEIRFKGDPNWYIVAPDDPFIKINYLKTDTNKYNL